MVKSRILLGVGIGLLLVMTAAFWVTPAPIEATPIGVLPTFVVKDGNGDVVGPVIGIDLNGRPTVAYDGDTNGRRAILSFEPKGFQPETFLVYYSGVGCTGTAYVRAPNSLFGLRPMTGITYGVGPGPSGHIWLYRSNSPGPGSTPSIQSEYTTASPDFTDGSKCQASGGSSDLVTATAAVDVTANFPPNYTAE